MSTPRRRDRSKYGDCGLWAVDCGLWIVEEGGEAPLMSLLLIMLSGLDRVELASWILLDVMMVGRVGYRKVDRQHR